MAWAVQRPDGKIELGWADEETTAIVRILMRIITEAREKQETANGGKPLTA